MDSVWTAEQQQLWSMRQGNYNTFIMDNNVEHKSEGGLREWYTVVKARKNNSKRY